jgi:hypothetical protein
MKQEILLMMFLGLMTSLVKAHAEVDPNFHIYLCFGQSNMEGNAQWEEIDNQYVDDRFQMLATTDFDSPNRTAGNWYKALCPIVSPQGKLGPSDYFGRTMVAVLPSNIKIGVVAVAMGGSPIEMFDKDKYQQKLKDNPNEWWATLAKNFYGGNPYGRLITMAKKAQESGVIKGILLHQGCSNCGDPNWPNMVKKIYNDMLTDLGLNAADVPLFVGETEREDMGGGCSYHNTVVAKIPQAIPTGHVVSSENIPGNGTDAWHFSAAGYRLFGRRYAAEVLKVMGRDLRKDADYTLPNNLAVFFTPKSFGQTILAKPNTAVVLKLMCTFQDSHREDVTAEATFTSNDFTIINGRVKVGEEGTKGVVTASWTDFLGTEHLVDITIESAGTDELGQRLTSVDQAFGRSFAIVNEADAKALYGTTDQNLAYDVYEKAFVATNSGYKFKMETSTVSGCYLLRLMTPQDTEYSVWGGYAPGYLNGFSTVADCSFILGLNSQNGQDVKNGAVWDIQYVDGMGFTLINKYTGKYLHDAASAKYDTPTYFSFCTLESVSAITPLTSSLVLRSSDFIYNLQGVKMGTKEQWHTMPKGVYIIDGKLTVKK